MVRLLNSVASQSFGEYEIIITDDTPGEEVQEVVKTFSGLPLRYFRNDPVAGTPGNWNLAIQNAMAPWVHLLHADDWYASPGSLAQFAEICRNSSRSFIFCASKEVNIGGKIIKSMQLSPSKRKLLEEDPLYLVYDNVIGHPSVVLHKKDNAIQYNPAFKWVVDIDFYLRFLNKYSTFEYIDQPLINIGIDEEQVSYTAYKNPLVEIPEYLHLINSIPEPARERNPYVFRCLWNLVKKFRIKEWGFIREHGYSGEKMEVIEYIIRYQRKIPRFILKQTDWSALMATNCYNRWMKTKTLP